MVGTGLPQLRRPGGQERAGGGETGTLRLAAGKRHGGQRTLKRQPEHPQGKEEEQNAQPQAEAGQDI